METKSIKSITHSLEKTKDHPPCATKLRSERIETTMQNGNQNGNKTDIAKTVMHRCENCDYNTLLHQNYAKHLLTAKHLGNTWKQSIITVHSHLICCCGKQFKTRSGVWKHKQKCNDNLKKCPKNVQENVQDNAQTNVHETNFQENAQNVQNDKNINFSTALIVSLLKQNQEFKEMIIEQNKHNQEIQNKLMEAPHIVNNNTTNNHNNTNNSFNLNVFLNETCKDALNMVDFVNSLHLQLSDLEETGKLGHSDGISRIFVNGLKELDVCKRPIHCSDLKREVLYIKEDNVWEKDNEQKTLIKQAIGRIESKNINQIPLWVKAHPECAVSSNKENTTYLKMVIQCTGGNNDGGENNINKIIKNIAKEVIIDKLQATK